MRLSAMHREFEGIRAQCEIDDGLLTVVNRNLCDALNCACARELQAKWAKTAFDEHFGKEPALFCTLCLDRDIIVWDQLWRLKVRNIKARFKRFLRRTGLSKARIMAVLDILLIARPAFPGKPQHVFALHWHFFIRRQDLSPQKEHRFRAEARRHRSTKRPLVIKSVYTESFPLTYLWKPTDEIKRASLKPDGTLYQFRKANIKGRYLGSLESFMTANPGPQWLFLQGLTRRSGKVIVKECVQQARVVKPKTPQRTFKWARKG